MIRIRIFKKMSESLKKKGIRSQVSFPFFLITKWNTLVQRKKEERNKRKHEPLVSLRRPESAEQAQFFSVFRLKGGKQEATVKCESRLRGGLEKKHLCPAEQAQFIAFFRQTEASRKRARRVSHARKEEYKKRKVKPAVPCTYANYSS